MRRVVCSYSERAATLAIKWMKGRRAEERSVAFGVFGLARRRESAACGQPAGRWYAAGSFKQESEWGSSTYNFSNIRHSVEACE